MGLLKVRYVIQQIRNRLSPPTPSVSVTAMNAHWTQKVDLCYVNVAKMAELAPTVQVEQSIQRASS